MESRFDQYYGAPLLQLLTKPTNSGTSEYNSNIFSRIISATKTARDVDNIRKVDGPLVTVPSPTRPLHPGIAQRRNRITSEMPSIFKVSHQLLNPFDVFNPIAFVHADRRRYLQKSSSLGCARHSTSVVLKSFSVKSSSTTISNNPPSPPTISPISASLVQFVKRRSHHSGRDTTICERAAQHPRIDVASFAVWSSRWTPCLWWRSGSIGVRAADDGDVAGDVSVLLFRQQGTPMGQDLGNTFFFFVVVVGGGGRRRLFFFFFFIQSVFKAARRISGKALLLCRRRRNKHRRRL